MRKQYDAVILEFSEALRHNPVAVFYENRGLAFHNKNEPDRAIADYNEALRIDPSRWGSYRIVE